MCNGFLATFGDFSYFCTVRTDKQIVEPLTKNENEKSIDDGTDDIVLPHYCERTEDCRSQEESESI